MKETAVDAVLKFNNTKDFDFLSDIEQL